MSNKNSKEGHDDISFEEDVQEVSSLSKMEQIKVLKEKLKKCNEEKQEYLLGWQRAKADLINTRKEETERLAKKKDVAEEKMIEDLLLVVDSFKMAFSNKESWEKVDENWRKGVEYIYGQLLTILEERGLTTFDVLGKDFDVQESESIGVVETQEKKKDGLVAEVVQDGYVVRGKVVRPAKVKVYSFKE